MTKLSVLLRDAPVGQLIRLASGGRYLRYPEEIPGFQIPWEAAVADEKTNEDSSTPSVTGPDNTRPATADAEKTEPGQGDSAQSQPATRDYEALTQMPTVRSSASRGSRLTVSRTKTREQTQPWSAERFSTEQEEAAERTQSAVIMPTRTADGVILVDWYTTDDPEVSSQIRSSAESKIRSSAESY
jgi:MFS transporter, DHA1 family, multidrug resistance protein